jgi:hypothetical protein
MISSAFTVNYGVLLASVFISFILVFIMGAIFLFLQIVFFPNITIIRTKKETRTTAQVSSATQSG